MTPGENEYVVTPGFEEILRVHRLDSLPALFAYQDGEPLDKPGLADWRRRFRVRLPVNGQEQVLYLKRFDRPPSSAHRELRRAGGEVRSLAGLEWTWAKRLAGDGIPCVRPVAFGEELQGRREIRSAILLASVPGASLEKWTRDGLFEPRLRARDLLQPLAALIARLHRCGYVHRDLYLSHIFFDPQADGDRFHLIDLQRVFKPRRMRRWIVKDLAALNASTPPSPVTGSDRLRWLKHYVGSRKLEHGAKRLALRVIGKTQTIMRHECRRQRRLHGKSRPTANDS